MAEECRIDVNILYTCTHFACVPAAGVDYTAVNTPEIRFTRHNAQIRDSDSIDVMILTDDNDNELEETFYLNFNPMRNALFIPPRIEITICGSKHKFYLKSFLLYSKKYILHIYTVCSLVDLTAVL